MTSPRITRADLSPDQVAAVAGLVQACRDADGVTPLSEHVLLHLRYDSTAAPAPGHDFQDIVLTVDGEVAGYAYADPPTTDPHSGLPEVSGELMIHPNRRRRGLGRALAAEVAAGAAGHPLRLW